MLRWVVVAAPLVGCGFSGGTAGGQSVGDGDGTGSGDGPVTGATSTVGTTTVGGTTNGTTSPTTTRATTTAATGGSTAATSDGSGGTTVGCTPVAEVCDGVDNDCDDKVDEWSVDNDDCNGCDIESRLGVAYYFCEGDRTYQDAQIHCEGFGANLLSVHDQPEQDFVVAMMPGNRGEYQWIGLSELVQEDQYLWEDGTPLDFEAWEVDQPNDFNGAQDCVGMYFSDGLWNDLRCGNQGSFFTDGWICKDVDP